MCKKINSIAIVIILLVFIPLANSNPGLSPIMKCDSSKIRSSATTYYCSTYPKIIYKGQRISVRAIAYANATPVKAKVTYTTYNLDKKRKGKKKTLNFTGSFYAKGSKAKQNHLIGPTLSVLKSDLPPGVIPQIHLVITPF